MSLAGMAMALAAAMILSGTAAAAQMSPRVAPGSEYPRRFGYVTMEDGVRLAYVVYLPRTRGRFPTVLQYEPYEGGGSGPRSWWPAGMWLENGYAVVLANVRGSGCSQGVLDVFGPHEGPDGAAIVDWIGTQPWSDRRVGMIGVSYPGFTQVLVAAQHPKFLRAITPSAVTASLYSEVIYPGGMLNVGFIAEWSLHDQPASEALGVKVRVGWGDRECESNYLAHPAPHNLLRSPRASVLRPVVAVALAGDICRPSSCPGLHIRNVAGQCDRVERNHGAVRASEGVRSVCRCLPEDIAGCTQRRRSSRTSSAGWTAGSRESRNGIDGEPPVTIYWESKGFPPVANWTTHYSSWPPPKAAMRTFWLTSAGVLSASAPANSPADAKGRSYTFPTGVELIGDNTQFAVPPDPNGSLTWTSAPFDHDVAILGRVRVQFDAASQNPDTDFEVDLHDVYPNGDIQYLQRGLLRASLRAVDQDESTPDHVAHGYRTPEYLVPGRIYQIQLSLPPLGAVLRKGHRLQLLILAPSPIPQPAWGLLPVNMPGQNTIYASARYPSEIVVPTIPGASAAGPEPACGSLASQPCRMPARH